MNTNNAGSHPAAIVSHVTVHCLMTADLRPIVDTYWFDQDGLTVVFFLPEWPESKTETLPGVDATHVYEHCIGPIDNVFTTASGDKTYVVQVASFLPKEQTRTLWMDIGQMEDAIEHRDVVKYLTDKGTLCREGNREERTALAKRKMARTMGHIEDLINAKRAA